MVEVQKYVIEHPEYMVDGLSMSQFSFQILRPLQENYVRKRPAAPRLTAAAHAGRPLEATEANHIAWAEASKNKNSIRIYNSSNLNISAESR
ncbi:hypothetical protein M0R45_018830 [Rubus argutus]|uniref:Uncharacterized protein n=1 Tax=Rubus argutus TaxID=59490 RepID=A0AAW1X4F9_RUBAR